MPTPIQALLAKAVPDGLRVFLPRPLLSSEVQLVNDKRGGVIFALHTVGLSYIASIQRGEPHGERERERERETAERSSSDSTEKHLPHSRTMKFVVVLVGAGSLAFLGAVICIVASVYPRKSAAPLGDNGTLTSEPPLDPLEPGSVAHAGPLGALHGADSYDGGNALGGIGLEVPTLNELHLGEETAGAGAGAGGGGSDAKHFSFSRLICTPVPAGECDTKELRRQRQQQQQQADEPLYGAGDEDWTYLRTTAEELRQTVLQQNDQILMDQRTIRELTGKLSECESGLEDERTVPERSVGVWSGNRRVMAGDGVSSSTAAQLQTARAVEELARAIMDLKDRIEKLEAEIGPAALNLTDTSVGTSSSNTGSSSSPAGNTIKAPSPPTGSASSPPAAAAPGSRRPASPASPAAPAAPKHPSKNTPGRGKGTWRVEDLDGELERKIKMLEKERQAMRKETQGQHEKINQGLDTANHRVTELEHSESGGENVGESEGIGRWTQREVDRSIAEPTRMRALREKSEIMSAVGERRHHSSSRKEAAD
ncbi:hypothetical protein F2P81_009936 [Scophthalmus maximus]|uniref:Uncharacterized protein n=1 Tax=Scophthalmus maximus TaxID=52904 RepID=A0A6A4T4F8_SCOMX|nr:hypothetical protein F2P81_009936 [Scophthalmus maximus]